MDQWKTEIKNHPIIETINSNLGSVDELSKSIDSVALETIYRIKFVLEYIKALIENSKTELLIKSILDEARSQLVHIVGDISNYTTNKNYNNFNNAVNSRLDTILRTIGSLPIAKKVNFPKQLNEITESYLKATYKRFEEIDNRGKEFDEKIKILNNQSQEFSQKLAQHNEALNNEKSRIDKIVSDFQSTILEVRTKIEEQASEQRDDIEVSYEEFKNDIYNKVQESLDKAKKNFDELINNYKINAERSIKDIESKKEEAAKLLGLASNIVHAGSYKKTSTEEKIVADKLRNFALISFGSAVIIGVIFLIISLIWPPTWQAIATRLSVIALVIGIGIYCAHESAQHRAEERNNKRMELELTSIDPYLESISDDKRDEVKVRLASRFFANSEIKNTKTSKTSPFIVKKLFKLLEDFIRRNNEGPKN